MTSIPFLTAKMMGAAFHRAARLFATAFSLPVCAHPFPPDFVVLQASYCKPSGTPLVKAVSDTDAPAGTFVQLSTVGIGNAFDDGFVCNTGSTVGACFPPCAWLLCRKRAYDLVHILKTAGEGFQILSPHVVFSDRDTSL
jgi:hypothetical protein